MLNARPVRLRHSKEWGASVPGHSVKPGDQLLIITRRGEARHGVVAHIIHRAEEETIVSLVEPAKPKRAKPA